MKHYHISFLRMAALLLVCALLTSPLAISKAKYVSSFESENQFYFVSAKNAPAGVLGTANGQFTDTPSSISIDTPGWWAFCLKGGDGYSITNADRSGKPNKGGVGGTVMGCQYFSAATTLYAIAGCAGARGWNSAGYGGGRGGDLFGSSGGGGGCSILTTASTIARTTAGQTAAIAVAGAGGGAGDTLKSQTNYGPGGNGGTIGNIGGPNTANGGAGGGTYYGGGGTGSAGGSARDGADAGKIFEGGNGEKRSTGGNDYSAGGGGSGYWGGGGGAEQRDNAVSSGGGGSSRLGGNVKVINDPYVVELFNTMIANAGTNGFVYVIYMGQNNNSASSPSGNF